MRGYVLSVKKHYFIENAQKCLNKSIHNNMNVETTGEMKNMSSCSRAIEPFKKYKIKSCHFLKFLFLLLR